MTEKIMIIDTETTNDINCPIMYDCSFIIADLKGNIYERKAFVVAEVFLNEELMSSAYYLEKKPEYWKAIKDGSKELKTLYNIKKAVTEIMAQYEITKVFAYNCRFDYLSTALTQRYLTKSKYRWFFPYGTEFYDILKMSRTVLKDNKEYIAFCEKNDYVTTYHKPRFTAEIVYRFFYDDSFVEEHKGLEDCEIEFEILLQCVGGYALKDCKLFEKDKRITKENLDKMPKA